MSAFELSSPGLRFTADKLRQYADLHDVPTDDNAIVFAQQMAYENTLRHGRMIVTTNDDYSGEGWGHKLDVSRDIPKTIPLVLGRLAFYDQQLVGSRHGVYNDHIVWVRLANIPAEDERIDEIIGIVGATRHADDPVYLDTDTDVLSRPIALTEHPYHGTDHRVVISQLPLHIGSPHKSVISIDLAPPEMTSPAGIPR